MSILTNCLSLIFFPHHPMMWNSNVYRGGSLNASGVLWHHVFWCRTYRRSPSSWMCWRVAPWRGWQTEVRRGERASRGRLRSRSTTPSLCITPHLPPRPAWLRQKSGKRRRGAATATCCPQSSSSSWVKEEWWIQAVVIITIITTTSSSRLTASIRRLHQSARKSRPASPIRRLAPRRLPRSRLPGAALPRRRPSLPRPSTRPRARASGGEARGPTAPRRPRRAPPPPPSRSSAAPRRRPPRLHTCPPKRVARRGSKRTRGKCRSWRSRMSAWKRRSKGWARRCSARGGPSSRDLSTPRNELEDKRSREEMVGVYTRSFDRKVWKPKRF